MSDKKLKKLDKKQEQRLKELDSLQRALEADKDMQETQLRQKAATQQRKEMRAITDQVMPIKVVHQDAFLAAERKRDAKIREANKEYNEAVEGIRMSKSETLASIEVEVEELKAKTEKSVSSGVDKVQKEFNTKLAVLVEERKAIRATL